MANRLRLIPVLILLPLGSLFGETLMEVSDRLDLRLVWDPFGGTARMIRGRDEMVLKTGAPFLLENYKTVRSVAPPVRKPDGTLFLPDETVRVIETFFPPRIIDPDHLRIAAVILDPGHGGKDPGAVGRFGKTQLQEKGVVLDTSLRVYRQLREAYPDKKIILTRDDDTFRRLEERTELANGIRLKENEAMIFVSVHANASINSRAKGFEVWYLPPEVRRTLVTPDMVKEEEKSAVPIINDLMDEETSTESIILAQAILRGMDRKIGGVSPNRGLKEESWYVVRNARMPSVLIELGFITHSEEGPRLGTPSYLKKLSDGIYNGLTEFIENFESSNGFTE